MNLDDIQANAQRRKQLSKLWLLYYSSKTIEDQQDIRRQITALEKEITCV